MIHSSLLIDRQIFIKFTREGIHRYPAAATDPKLATGNADDVSFLANPHRHIFHFRVSIAVKHNDRDIEFIQFKRELEGLYSAGTMQMDYKSCEMLGEELIQYITDKYPNRKGSVEVSEDGENGAILSFYTS
jgi:hypothetical protein